MWEGMSDSESLVVFSEFCLAMVRVQECGMVQCPQSICYLFLQTVHCSPVNIPEKQKELLIVCSPHATSMPLLQSLSKSLSVARQERLYENNVNEDVTRQSRQKV